MVPFKLLKNLLKYSNNLINWSQIDPQNSPFQLFQLLYFWRYGNTLKDHLNENSSELPITRKSATIYCIGKRLKGSQEYVSL